jgi:hypothetical protein
VTDLQRYLHCTTLEEALPQSSMVCNKSLAANEALIVPVNPDDHGPMDEYDDRVATGRLRDDEHQRGDY